MGIYPDAQAILGPLLKTDIHAYVFTPAEIMAQRYAQWRQGLSDGRRARLDKRRANHHNLCGARGKVDNCVVTVHLAWRCGPFMAMLDNDLFLPEHTGAKRTSC